VASVLRSGHPSADFILAHQRGEVAGAVPHADHVPVAPGTSVHAGNGVVILR